MGETIVTWNWPNWITIGLMSLVFFAVVGFGIQAYSSATGGGQAPATPQ